MSITALKHEIDALLHQYNELNRFQVPIQVVKLAEKSDKRLFKKKKEDEISNRVLVLGTCRLFLLKMEQPTLEKKKVETKKEIFELFLYDIVSFNLTTANNQLEMMYRIAGTTEQQSVIIQSPIPAKILAKVMLQISLISGAKPLPQTTGDKWVSESTPFDFDYPVNHVISTYPAYCNLMGVPEDKSVALKLRFLAAYQITTLDTSSITSLKPSEQAGPLIHSLSYDPYFKGLVVTDSTRRETISDVTTLLKTRRNLTKLVVSNIVPENPENVFSELATGLAALAKMLPLQHLDLSGCPFGSQFLPLSKVFAFQDLTYFSIAQCGIPEQIMADFLNVFQMNARVSSEIKYYDISGNYINSSGWELFIMWIRKYAKTAKLETLKLAGLELQTIHLKKVNYFPNLTELDLSENNFESAFQLQGLSSFIEKNKTLTKLHLENSNIGHSISDTANLFRTIWKRSRPLHVSTAFNELVGECYVASLSGMKISTLDLSYLLVKEQTLVEILQIICSSVTGLQSLNLSGCLIEAPGTTNLTTPLYNLSQLHSLTDVNLSNQIGPGVIGFLKGLLTKKSKITKLNITNNSLGMQGLVALCNAISECRLKSLHCDQNLFDLRAWNLIFEAMNAAKTKITDICYPSYDLAAFLALDPSPVSKSQFYQILFQIEQFTMASQHTEAGFFLSSSPKLQSTVPKAPVGNKLPPAPISLAHLATASSGNLLLERFRMKTVSSSRLMFLTKKKSIQQNLMSNGLQIPVTLPGCYDNKSKEFTFTFKLWNPFATLGSRSVPNEDKYYDDIFFSGETSGEKSFEKSERSFSSLGSSGLGRSDSRADLDRSLGASDSGLGRSDSKADLDRSFG